MDMMMSLCSVGALCVAAPLLNSETVVGVVPELPAAAKVAVDDERGTVAKAADEVVDWDEGLWGREERVNWHIELCLET